MPLLGLAPTNDRDAVADDDAALLGRMARADSGALGALYDRHAPMLLGAALRMLGSQREAQDLLHDVFLEAWEHAQEYDATRGTVRAWLFVRLRSRALDRLGRAERARHVASRSERQGASPSVDDFVAVRQALARLPHDVRRALDLTYFEGPHRERDRRARGRSRGNGSLATRSRARDARGAVRKGDEGSRWRMRRYPTS